MAAVSADPMMFTPIMFPGWFKQVTEHEEEAEDYDDETLDTAGMDLKFTQEITKEEADRIISGMVRDRDQSITAEELEID